MTDVALQKRTKVVATIGPATETEEIMEQLIRAGMNMARFNTKHGTPEWHKERMERVRKVAQKMGVSISILLDLQGPEIRINVPNGTKFDVQKNDEVVFSSKETEVLKETHAAQIPQVVVEALSVGDHILVDDGLGEFEIVKKEKTEVIAKALGNFPVGHRKTLNTPGVTVKMPSLIPADMVQLDGASDELVDFVGLSFVRDTKDIDILKAEMKKRGLHAGVMAKIENQAAVDNLESILEASDAVMVARGDLAVEVPFKQLAYLQKTLIRKAREQAKPVITATQMLKSMVENPRPTRAEVSDVANAVYDGTDAVMLSEETTIGKYPVEAVATEAMIAEFNEQYAEPKNEFTKDGDDTEAIAHAAISLVENSQVKVSKIVCLTETGRTARLLSRFRVNAEIEAVTNDQRTYQKLALSYGVRPHLVEFKSGAKIELDKVLSQLTKQGDLKKGDHILVVHGDCMIKRSMTNTLSLITIE